MKNGGATIVLTTLLGSSSQLVCGLYPTEYTAVNYIPLTNWGEPPPSVLLAKNIPRSGIVYDSYPPRINYSPCMVPYIGFISTATMLSRWCFMLVEWVINLVSYIYIPMIMIYQNHRIHNYML